MAVSAGVAFLDIIPKLDQKALSGIRGQLNRLGSSLTSIGTKLTKTVTAPIVGLGIVAVKAFMDSQKIAAQTEAVIKSTGGVAGMTAKSVQDLATELSRLSGIDDETIKSSENLLLTFTKIQNKVGDGNDIFNQATEAALNVSIAFKKSLTSSSIMVGKALNDPIKGVTALTRVGVQFTEQQKDQIEAMVKSGDLLGAQKLILAELERQTGGSAKAYGTTLAGAMERVRTEVGNLAEAFGETLAPYVKKAADFVQNLVTNFQELSPKTRRVIVLIAGIAAAAGPVLLIVGSLAKLLTAAFSPAGLIVLGIAAVVAGFVYLWKHSEKFREMVDRVVALFKKWWPKITKWVGDLGAVIAEKVVAAVKWLREAWEVAGPVIMELLGYIGKIIMDIAKNYIQALIEAWQNIWPAIKDLWDAAEPVLKILGIILAVTLVGAIKVLANTFKVLYGVAAAMIKAISVILRGIIWVIAQVIREITTSVKNAYLVIKAVVDGIKTVVIGVWNGIKAAWSQAGQFFKGVWDGIKNGAKTAWDAITSSFKAVVNSIIGAWNSLDFGIHVTVPDWLKYVPFASKYAGQTFGIDDIFPDIPYLASGGVVRQPTLAMVGESGPEAVVPLNRMGAQQGSLRITDWRRGLATLDWELDYMALARGE